MSQTRADLEMIGHTEIAIDNFAGGVVSTGSVAFFTVWGGWNIFYYPHLDQLYRKPS